MTRRAHQVAGAAHPGGFTLLEMLCSLAIIGLVMGLAIPALRRVPDGAKLEAAARLVAASLRLARSDAIAGNREVTVAIDADGRILKPSNRGATNLPADVGVHMKVARQTRSSASTGGLIFFPDGTSSGGDIELALNARSARIVVNWLDGEARLDLVPGGVGIAEASSPL